MEQQAFIEAIDTINWSQSLSKDFFMIIITIF